MRRTSPICALLALVLAESPALAQTASLSPSARVGAPATGIDTTTPSTRQPSDTTAGHVLLVGRAGFVSPYGWLEPGSSFRDHSSGGLGLGLDADVGVSRSVSVGLWGSAALLSARADCGCTIRSFAAGPLVRYRVAQGMRFDPWVGVGAGGQVTPVDQGTTTTYTGIDWLHASLGGDWYAASGLLLGPMIAADFGTFVSPETAFHWQLEFGLRIGLDLPGR